MESSLSGEGPNLSGGIGEICDAKRRDLLTRRRRRGVIIRVYYHAVRCPVASEKPSILIDDVESVKILEGVQSVDHQCVIITHA